MQQYCHCSSSGPPICWKVACELAFRNSRYLNTAENNYAPSEGGAVPVAWALNKARLFLLDCKYFTVLANHKRLVKIFRDETLQPRTFEFQRKYTSVIISWTMIILIHDPDTQLVNLIPWILHYVMN